MKINLKQETAILPGKTACFLGVVLLGLCCILCAKASNGNPVYYFFDELFFLFLCCKNF